MDHIAASKPGSRRGRILGLASIGVGVVLLGAAGLLVWQHFTAPPVYRYVMGEPVPAAELGPLATLGADKVTVRRATVMSVDHPTPLADLEVAESAHGPVLVAWQPRVDDPFLTILPPAEDIAALAPVLERHVTPETPVLAWWDSSRQMRMLSGVEVMFGQHLGTPMFVPARWRASRSSMQSVERSFWKSGDVAQEQARFESFAGALLADEDEGMAQLRALAGGRKTVLVLHARDVILLGQMAPKKIGVAFRDFGALGDVHGQVRRVHEWLDKEKYPAYTVLQHKDQPVRAVALTDEASARTLIARLLPFMGNDQHDVKGATLVYQVGGFSVYEIAAQAPAQAADQGAAAAPTQAAAATDSAAATRQ